MTNNCNDCGNAPCIENNNCDCKVFLKTSCITNVDVTVPCSGIIKGLPFNEFIIRFSDYICARFTSMENFFDLVNVGVGAGKVYKGISPIGKKELKSLKQIGLITVTDTTNDIEISINETLMDAFVKAHQTTSTTVNAQSTTGALVGTPITTVNNTVTPIKAITSNNGSVVITNTANTVNLEVLPAAQSGVTSVTGTGRITVNNSNPATPIVGIAAADTAVTSGSNNLVESGAVFTAIAAINGSETKVTAGTNVTVTGNGTTLTPYIINSTAVSGGSTAYVIGTSKIEVVGTGTSINPYIISERSLKKIIKYGLDFTTSYTLGTLDNGYTIIVDNLSNDVDIIADNLPNPFKVEVIQRGNGNVSFITSNNTHIIKKLPAKDNIIEGINGKVILEREFGIVGTNYYLNGDLAIKVNPSSINANKDTVISGFQGESNYFDGSTPTPTLSVITTVPNKILTISAFALGLGSTCTTYLTIDGVSYQTPQAGGVGLSSDYKTLNIPIAAAGTHIVTAYYISASPSSNGQGGISIN